MSTTVIRSLKALVALAEVDLGEAALTLADRLDEQTRVRHEVEEGQAHLSQIGEVFDRLSSPGAVVNSAAMSMLVQQSLAEHDALNLAQARLTQSDQLVDEQRQLVHQQQHRHDGLKDFLKEARKAHAAHIDKHMAQEVEDLFLARRILAKEHA